MDILLKKNGLFYDKNHDFGSHHSLEKSSKLGASFIISYDEITEITTSMVVAWEDVENVNFNGKFLDKTEYKDYTLFYGYSLEYTNDFPILYDEKFNVIDYKLNNLIK